MNLTAVIGPPGVGKSTLTERLSGRLTGRLTGGQAGTVLRMRDLAHEYRPRAGTEVGAPSVTDPLGWLPDRTANRLLRAALRRACRGGAGLVVLENLPGSLAQSVALRQQARELSARLAVVELQAPDVVVAERVRRRRVCPGCERGHRGDPHRPATGRRDAPHACARCGTALARRPGDAVAVFTARLDRYRTRIAAIRADLAGRRAAVPGRRRHRGRRGGPRHRGHLPRPGRVPVRPRCPHAVDHLNAPAKESTRARLDRHAAARPAGND